jgi:hypothetical protein
VDWVKTIVLNLDEYEIFDTGKTQVNATQPRADKRYDDTSVCHNHAISQHRTPAYHSLVTGHLLQSFRKNIKPDNIRSPSTSTSPLIPSQPSISPHHAKPRHANANHARPPPKPESTPTNTATTHPQQPPPLHPPNSLRHPPPRNLPRTWLSALPQPSK